MASGTFCTEFDPRRHSGTRIYTHGSMKDSSVRENARGSAKPVDVGFSVVGTIKVQKNSGSRLTEQEQPVSSRRIERSKLTGV